MAKLITMLIVLGAVLLMSCGDDESPPTAEERATFCRDLDNAQQSLGEVIESAPAALLPANQAAFQDTLQKARADVDALDSSARELEGGSDAVAELRLDVQEFRAIMATPDLARVAPQLQRKADEIQADLQAIGDENRCP